MSITYGSPVEVIDPILGNITSIYGLCENNVDKEMCMVGILSGIGRCAIIYNCNMNTITHYSLFDPGNFGCMHYDSVYNHYYYLHISGESCYRLTKNISGGIDAVYFAGIIPNAFGSQRGGILKDAGDLYIAAPGTKRARFWKLLDLHNGIYDNYKDIFSESGGDIGIQCVIYNEHCGRYVTFSYYDSPLYPAVKWWKRDIDDSFIELGGASSGTAVGFYFGSYSKLGKFAISNRQDFIQAFVDCSSDNPADVVVTFLPKISFSTENDVVPDTCIDSMDNCYEELAFCYSCTYGGIDGTGIWQVARDGSRTFIAGLPHGYRNGIIDLDKKRLFQYSLHITSKILNIYNIKAFGGVNVVLEQSIDVTALNIFMTHYMSILTKNDTQSVLFFGGWPFGSYSLYKMDYEITTPEPNPKTVTENVVIEVVE